MEEKYLQGYVSLVDYEPEMEKSKRERIMEKLNGVYNTLTEIIYDDMIDDLDDEDLINDLVNVRMEIEDLSDRLYYKDEVE